MKEALKEAKKAYDNGEIPIGAIIVKDGKIIARAHNQKEEKNDATKHAEIIAIQKASKKVQGWRLENCEMYVTLEPCMMCTGAIIQSRIKKVYYLLDSDYYENLKKNTGNVKITKIDKENEYDRILSNFFKTIRKK